MTAVACTARDTTAAETGPLVLDSGSLPSKGHSNRDRVIGVSCILYSKGHYNRDRAVGVRQL